MSMCMCVCVVQSKNSGCRRRAQCQRSLSRQQVDAFTRCRFRFFHLFYSCFFFYIYQKRVQNAVHLSWLRINAKMRISFVYLLHAPMIWIRERHRDRERGKNCTRYLLIDHFCVDKTFAESIILLWLSHGTRCGQTIEWTEHWTRDKITLNFLLHIWLYSIFFPALCCFEERESVCVFWRS